MRTFLITLLFVSCWAAPARAEETFWIYKLEASRPNLMETLTPEEVELLKAHQVRLVKLREEGRLVLAGVCEDYAFGVVIFRAKSREVAQMLVDDDPVVEGGLLKADLHPFSKPLLPR
jgi:uncharacterized protein YciI